MTPQKPSPDPDHTQMRYRPPLLGRRRGGRSREEVAYLEAVDELFADADIYQKAAIDVLKFTDNIDSRYLQRITALDERTIRQKLAPYIDAGLIESRQLPIKLWWWRPIEFTSYRLTDEFYARVRRSSSGDLLRNEEKTPYDE